MPCNTRADIRIGDVHAAPDNIDPRPKSKIAVNSVDLRPNISASCPHLSLDCRLQLTTYIGMKTDAVMRYPVIYHMKTSSPCMSVTILGRAIAMADASSADKRETHPRTTNINQNAGVGLNWVSSSLICSCSPSRDAFANMSGT